MKIYTTFIASLFLMAGVFSASAQDKKMHHEDKADIQYNKLEKMQDNIESNLIEVYGIIEEYPDFSYEYVYEDGILKDVKVSGIDNPTHQEDVATLIYNVRSAKDDMRNYSSRVGIYYAPEQEAEPKVGYEQFREKVQENIQYPDNAENYGVEGTVYVKFIVDENGEIAFVTADQAIDSPYKQRVEKMKKEAVEAVKETDVDWEPAVSDGEIVDSWAVIPVTFDFRKDPFLPALIR